MQVRAVGDDGEVLAEAEVESGVSRVAEAASGLRLALRDNVHGVGARGGEVLRKAEVLTKALVPAEVSEALAVRPDEVVVVEAPEELGVVVWPLVGAQRAWGLGRGLLERLGDGAVGARGRRSMLILADPGGDLEAAWAEGDVLLEWALERLEDLGWGVEFHSGEVSRTWLLENVGRFGIVHFCGHVEVDGSGEHMVLSGRQRVSLAEVASACAGSAPGLLFLSACGPPVSEARAARSFSHLARAGLRAIVWPYVRVPDSTLTISFAKRFYEGLFAGRRFAEALLDARKHLASAQPETSFWAVYGAFGDPAWAPEYGPGRPEEAAAPVHAAAGSGPGDGQAGGKGAGEMSEFLYMECREPGCFRRLPGDRWDDPFNAYCDEHARPLEKKMTELRRLLATGAVREWVSPSDLARAYSSYRKLVAGRLEVLARAGEVALAAGRSAPRFRVDTPSMEWSPLARAFPLESRLSLLGHGMDPDVFPEEGVLRFGLTIVERKGLIPTKHRMEVEVLLSCDLNSLARDGFLWRPSSASEARRWLQMSGLAEEPGPETVRAWAMPFGIAGRSGSSECPGGVLVVRMVGEPEVSVCAPAGGLKKTAAEALAGLLDPRGEEDLGAKIEQLVAAEGDIGLSEAARRLRSVPWRLLSLCRTGHTASRVRVTEMEDGEIFLSRRG